MSGKPRIGGLGRGLGALIPTAPPPEPDGGAGHRRAPGAGQRRAPRADRWRRSKRRPRPRASGRSEPAASPRAELVPVAGAEFAELPIDRIRANTKQPRQVFDEDALAELTHSVREFGVLQPVVVRRDPDDADGYELVMGERRLRAAAAAG